jgi:hypothetical protein
MRIEYVTIWNYKCFRYTGKIDISSRVTALIGQNNAGKTAFLEALKPGALQNKPHLEPLLESSTFPRLPIPESSVEFGVSLSGEELKWRLLSTSAIVCLGGRLGRTRRELQSDVKDILNSSEISFVLSYRGPDHWSLKENPFEPADGSNTPAFMIYLMPSPTMQSVQTVLKEGYDPALADSIDFDHFLGDYLKESVYLFRAERQNAEIASISPEADLRSDAGNLASALLQLVADPGAKAKFSSFVSTVFPSIYEVVSRPIEGGRAQVFVINSVGSGRERRPGIAVPLGDSGSGIGQVVAMLYVAQTAHQSKIIVIDEPNNFCIQVQQRSSFKY